MTPEQLDAYDQLVKTGKSLQYSIQRLEDIVKGASNCAMVEFQFGDTDAFVIRYAIKPEGNIQKLCSINELVDLSEDFRAAILSVIEKRLQDRKAQFLYLDLPAE